ncbi:hypothetical protein JHK87_047556 [Glycine soja]|nr:hypothetical protein JHK87_047556 [Glycine soja]
MAVNCCMERKNSMKGEEVELQLHGESTLYKAMEEIKDLCNIVIPTIIMGLITYGKSAISMYFLGKLSKKALVGGSLAIGVANITGYSIISSLATSMDGISS